MIEFVKGKIAYLDGDYVAIECNSIAYKVYITSRTAGVLKNGEDITIYTYLNITQQFETYLYGFTTRQERAMFEKLIGVSGVGPKAALSVLSTLDISQIATALISSDSKAFARANGIGAKTANRIVLELKDKVEISELIGQENAVVISPGQEGAASEALDALLSLGYNRAEASQAIAIVKDNAETAEELTLLALKQMSLR